LATGEPITFTVTGHGGLSNPVADFQDEAFWWADASARVSTATYASTGFSIAPQPAGSTRTLNEGEGSLLLSSAFTVQDGEELSFSMDVFAGLLFVFEVDTVGFAVLLEDSQLHSILAVVRPDGQRTGTIDGLNTTHHDFAPPTPGVVTTMTTDFSPATFTLGGQTYNTVLEGQDQTCCITTVHSTLTPGAGTYQLLIGAFSFNTQGDVMGVAVTQVTVPEVNLTALLALGFVAIIFTRRRR
jgi:hypothetical protein